MPQLPLISVEVDLTMSGPRSKWTKLDKGYSLTDLMRWLLISFDSVYSSTVLGVICCAGTGTTL